MQAKRGQTVLLSPASASFDAFAGYEERGDRFVEIVQSFARAEPASRQDGQQNAGQDEAQTTASGAEDNVGEEDDRGAATEPVSATAERCERDGIFDGVDATGACFQDETE